MKVQYQLVDVETKKAIPVGEVFEIIDDAGHGFDNTPPMSWKEAAILFGDPLAIPTKGVIYGVSPIAAARKSLLGC